MRQLTTLELNKVKALTEKSVDITLIEPTATGLKKSILDATASVRTYLLEHNVHDYQTQLQGQNFKILVDAKFISENKVTNSMASLYRPETKKGDPRIWFRKLGEFSRANDILGIIAFKGGLFVINLTRLNIEKLINSNTNNPLKELVLEINRINFQVAEELLYKLRKIASKGFIPALLSADTSVGRTLEHLLGIDINSSKQPDYKGIELKSFRQKRSNRKTLFAQVPDWNLSKFKSSAEILNNFGYKRGLDFKLYCTISSIVRNSQGLKLRIDNKANHLLENSDKANIGDFVVWALETLHSRLEEKHNETFWISAESKIVDHKEYFAYKKIEHTRKPILSQFDILLEQGLITLDHLIKRNSKGKVIEKGPLFKIRPTALNLLFPPSKVYNLA